MSAPPQKRRLEAEVSDTEDLQQSGSARITIDPDGDLVLVINKQELLVSQKVLCLSSSIFRAMLRDGSRFLESTDQVIASDGLRHIHLVEDDYRALVIFASVIHMQYDNVPQSVSWEVLNTIATLCDKYDLRRSFGLWPQKWSEPYTQFAQTSGYQRWLFLALVFRNVLVLPQVSRSLMLSTTLSETGELQAYGSNWFTDGVPPRVLG